jgi:hypothetical protein
VKSQRVKLIVARPVTLISETPSDYQRGLCWTIVLHNHGQCTSVDFTGSFCKSCPKTTPALYLHKALTATISVTGGTERDAVSDFDVSELKGHSSECEPPAEPMKS